MLYRDVVASDDGPRIAQGLLRLRGALRASVAPKTLGDCVLLATWNIRDFGRGRNGGRTPEALAYIPEILGHFDLVAVHEVNEDLAELDAVCHLLGPWWSRIYTDVTEGAPGNRERPGSRRSTRRRYSFKKKERGRGRQTNVVSGPATPSCAVPQVRSSGTMGEQQLALQTLRWQQCEQLLGAWQWRDLVE